MGLRMRKSITICKGVRVNFGKTGTSLSFGTRGLRQTIHSSGRVTSSIGIPGTGLSYVTTSGGNKRSRSVNALQAKQIRQQEKYNELKNNQLLVEQYNNFVKSLKSIHIYCDNTIDWVHINSICEPFNPNEIGPKQVLAIQLLDNFKPNFFQRIFKKLEAKKRAELSANIEKATEEDKSAYDEWKELNILSSRILMGDIDAYFEVIDEMNPLNDLLEYGSDFEFGANNAYAMEVEFRVKSQQIVPSFSTSLTKTGKLSKKDLTKTAYYELVQDYVCSCAMRIARDMFALLPIKTVVVHAVDNIINSETGHTEDVTILSVVFDKDKLNMLNFQALDPSDSMNNFLHNMKFLKTAGFKPVSRITNY